ncbi:MAG: hypothetical protein PF482_11760 [Desulfobacteraceae bacterium]|jgi:hypothetical protein|nr:hypothetical protein [Desulfobacteraceae bacterium]
MISKIWPVNILLFVVILIFSIKAYDVWFTDKFNPGRDSVGEQQQKQGGKPDVKVNDMPTSSFYNAIVEKNLFFSDRIGVEDNVPQPAVNISDQKISEQEIVLYGVMMAGGEKQALISNPYPKKDGSKTIWVKVDERVADDPDKPEIKVKSILKDKIVISIDGKEFDRDLFQKKDNQDQPDAIKNIKPEQNGTKRRSFNDNPNIVDNPIPQGDPTGKTPAPSFEISPDGKYKIFETPFVKIKRRNN